MSLLEVADCRIDMGFVYISKVIVLNGYAANYKFCTNNYSVSHNSLSLLQLPF